MIDHTKVQFSTAYNSYKNIGVYSTYVQVLPGNFMQVKNFDRTITVEPGTRFAYVKVQTNHETFNGSTFVPTALRWSILGYGGDGIYQTLNVDPYGGSPLYLWWSMIISGNNVTFRLSANNPYDAAVSFNAMNALVEYATFTTDN